MGSELRKFLPLALALASAQLAQAATGLVDTLMMGWLGTDTLAAGSLATGTMMAVQVVGTGMVVAVTPLVAAAQGQGDRAQVSHWSQQGLWISLLVAMAGMPLLLLLPSLMAVSGQPSLVVAGSRTYLTVMTLGLGPALFFTMFKGVLGAVGHAPVVTWIGLAGLAVNAGGNYLLGFGRWGFPAWGLGGLAVATVVAHWFMALGAIAYALWYCPDQKLLAWPPPWQARALGQIFHLGWPLSVAFGLEVGLFTTVTFLMGTLGTIALAAHQVVFQTIVVAFMVPLGIGLAATVRVGHYFGQQDAGGVRRVTQLAIGLSGGFMAMMAGWMWAQPRSFVGLYLDLGDPANREAIELGVSLLRIAAIAQVADGIQTTLAGVLRGLQDTRSPMFLGSIAFWAIGLPMGCWLGFGWRWGAQGLWIGQSLGVLVAAVLFYGRWRRLDLG